MLDVLPIGIKEDNWYKDKPDVFTIPPETRRKHQAIFGATGTGKSVFLTNQAAWDIAAGTGITVVDPHGGLYEQLLLNHIPRNRKNDVILFDPRDRTHAIGLNVLDCPRHEDRGLVVSHVVAIFHKLWESSWGARLEHILRNALWVLIEQPEPTSLLALPKLLTNAGFRAELLAYARNPKAIDFFCNQFDRWSASFREEAISPVLNKCDAFLTDPMMRAIIGQPRSSFNFRWLIDHRKILLCNLAKGLIGDDNSRLLGSLVILKEKLAALSREDTPESERVPHALFVEEAQSFIGDFQSIFAETRKYWLPLTIATQGTESLSPEDGAAVFSNCATLISFRVSGADAERLAREFGSEISASHLQDLPDYHFYVRTLTRKRAVTAASPSGAQRIKAHPPFARQPNSAWPESVIRVSQARYARPRPLVENELKRNFFSQPLPSPRISL